jgi:hypothetical protein
MYNFLCVGGEKYGCNLFTTGSYGKIVDVQEALSDISLPLCWAGSHKETLYRHCIENKRKFYNLDTGYFGNTKRKEIVRISVNNLQDQGPIIQRPADRLDTLNLEILNFKRGDRIVIVPPDEKISKVFKLSNTWVDDVKTEIKKYTDRPIYVRNRPLSRSDRLNLDTFKDCINNNTYAVIGYSSNALVESVICGIPAIALGHSAINSLFNHTLSNINNIPDIDQHQRYQWLCHLAYRQFTHRELSDGTAWNLLSAES